MVSGSNIQSLTDRLQEMTAVGGFDGLAGGLASIVCGAAGVPLDQNPSSGPASRRDMGNDIAGLARSGLSSFGPS